MIDHDPDTHFKETKRIKKSEKKDAQLVCNTLDYLAIMLVFCISLLTGLTTFHFTETAGVLMDSGVSLRASDDHNNHG